jgi:hypothetical protein
MCDWVIIHKIEFSSIIKLSEVDFLIWKVKISIFNISLDFYVKQTILCEVYPPSLYPLGYAQMWRVFLFLKGEK